MKKNAKFWVIIALVICLISSVGASVIQTNFGSVDYTNITIPTDGGRQLDALLLVPDGVTEANKAPAIVLTHGWYNTKENQDLNYIEYARRGYVVLSVTQYGHGDSSVITDATFWNPENNANGLYDAVKYVAELPYVDTSRIGVSGHSAGSQACREAVLLDDEGLIAAALLVSNDAVYYDENGNLFNQFGSRDAAIVACQYDEFFHRFDGSAPRDFINQIPAQSFLHFGVDPTGLETRNSYTYYTQEIDGETAIRAIFNPNTIHPGALFSTSVVANSVEFFDEALDAPVDLAHNDQIWIWKAIFNGIGVVGFFMLLINGALALLDLPFFADLKASEPVLPAPARQGKSKGRYVRRQIWSLIWSILTFFLTFILGYILYPKFLNQEVSRCLGYWSVLTGLLLLAQMKKARKKDGVDPVVMGSKISKVALGKSILLSLIVVTGAYAVVFLSDAVLLTDYRFWSFANIRAFKLDLLPVALKFLPFWLMYFVPMSVSTNCYNYVEMGGCKSKSVLITAIWVALIPVILIVAQYATFFSTGYMLTEALSGTAVLWMFPILIYMPLSVFICHKIYLKTRNPYIGGILMGIIVTLFNVTNTLTVIY